MIYFVTVYMVFILVILAFRVFNPRAKPHKLENLGIVVSGIVVSLLISTDNMYFVYFRNISYLLMFAFLILNVRSKRHNVQ